MFKDVTNDGSPFLIAEVGQNHQGDLEKAREFIRIFAYEGADAIKFQTRNNRHLFSENAYHAAYDSENAFAKTYGAHREQLELQPEWLPTLKKDCDHHGVKFMSTPFDEPSLDLLINVDVDILKIASFDIGNLPFIDLIGKTGKPVAMSIGGGKFDQIRSSVKLLERHQVEISLLHCVSEYPCEYDRLGLENITLLAEAFPNCTIGSSDHFNGTLSGPVAYLQGARVFEKHVTLNRAWRGTDHSFALEPQGFRNFTRDVRRVRFMLPSKPAKEIGAEAVFKKLGKSIVAARDLVAGETLTLDNLSGRIFTTQYVPVRETGVYLGKVASVDIKCGDPITPRVVK